MIANYHTHTWRCHHAMDMEREYVERAIEGGLKILGFSDHTPYFHLDDPNSRVRMMTSQLDDYVDTVLSLRDEYADDIEIHLGLEVEFYPKYFEKLMMFLEDYPVEYMILGQHFLFNEEPQNLYSGVESRDPANLKQYVDQCIEGFDTGAYLYLAHPDLYRFVGDPKVFDREYRRLCKAAKERDIPLELNFLGISDRRWYPNGNFWKIAGEVGNTVIFGCDAHQAERMWNPEAEKKALKIVKDNQLTLIHSMELDTLID